MNSPQEYVAATCAATEGELSGHRSGISRIAAPPPAATRTSQTYHDGDGGYWNIYLYTVTVAESRTVAVDPGYLQGDTEHLADWELLRGEFASRGSLRYQDSNPAISTIKDVWFPVPVL